MRVPVVLLVLALLAAGCQGADAGRPVTPAGCGLVSEKRVVGLLGHDVHTNVKGSASRLRKEHAPLTCRTVVQDHAERYVTIRATYHPEPYQLPPRSCSAGWLVAGSVAKSAPACQETVDGHGRTRLVVRWQPYLVQVTVGRSDRNWGGDAEVALAMSRELARRLGVDEAAGDS